MKLFISLALIATATAGNNVLLIIADDYGVDAHSLYNPGGTTAPTPNINTLAAAGIRFTSAYACPVCSPTRAAILTGRLGFRTGVGDVISASNTLTSAELTLPEVITQNSHLGIAAASFGKWHLSSGTPNAVRSLPNTIGGWPHYAGATSGALTDYTNWTKTTNGVTSTSTTYATTDVVNDASAWISARNTAGQQWLAWVAFNAPHTPFHIPPPHLHSYGSNPANNSLKYSAAVEAMDTEIGRLLLSIDPATTDIIFIGDNGTPGQVIQSPYNNARAKDTLYEGGTRVPCIVKGPSVTSGGRTDSSLVHIVDLFSTMLDLAGVPLPASVTLDSKSLKPLLSNQGDISRTRLYVEQFDQAATTTGGRVLRDDRYKLIRFNNATDQFYDILADPAEAFNLLAGGIAALHETHQMHYFRLRFNLGRYTNTTIPSPLSHSLDAHGFELVVPENTAAGQTMWQSADLDFWKPVSGAGRSTSSGKISFTCPHPLPDSAFFSILTEPL
ncbi:MAG: sulfatase-like hydrolase/transferase [Akkermansiaceae bacterium]